LMRVARQRMGTMNRFIRKLGSIVGAQQPTLPSSPLFSNGVVFLAIGAVLLFVQPAAAQLTTSSPSFKGLPPPPSNTLTGGQTTPTPTTPSRTTPNNTDPATEFEQMFVGFLRETLAQRFPGADQEEINFLADLVFGFFLEQLVFGPMHHMGTPNSQ